MIFFPTLYEDELLHSVLARYHHYTGNENNKLTMEDLFDSRTACASVILPSNLRKLCNRLPTPNVYTPDSLIENHTIFPYYAPFIPEIRYNELKLAMIDDIETNSYMKLGITASRVKIPQFLRYCPDCAIEDGFNNGEIYWHRIHQIEGVEICPKHYTFLVNSKIPSSQRKSKHKFFRIEQNGGNNNQTNLMEKDSEVFNHYNFIAQQTYLLINSSFKPLGLEKLRKFYITKLQVMGLATISGRIKWRNLIPSFNNYYGEEILSKFNCSIKLDQEDTWIHKMLRNNQTACHPLRHILLLGFIGETVSSMVEQINSVNYDPFGTGPWPCLNKAANHFRESIVNSCIVTRDYKTGKPIGTFSCLCGFVYSRKGPDITLNDRCRIGRIKEFGHIWKAKLIEIANMDISLRKKAEILGVDPMTVKRKLLGEEKEDFRINRVNSNLTVYRVKWLEILQNNKGSTITEIRNCFPNIYSYLIRNDKEWLRKNYPDVIKTSAKKINRVDWNKRDLETAEKVKLVAKEILLETTQLIRVTKNEIGRRLRNLGSLYNNLSKMPKTQQILDKVVESIEEFQVRRIKHVAKELKITNSVIKEWELIRRAGLKGEFVEMHKDVIKSESI
ncbi:TnsD family transposase [Robertmurraya sp. P23]|uniref:TnsD family transposase n=1 Tax=Robertmurraya sp. P23 TaxID=3436931 RepID=UPI003D97E7B2